MIRRHLKKWMVPVLVVLIALPLLSACGKKGSLERPSGEKTDYPRQYPGR